MATKRVLCAVLACLLGACASSVQPQDGGTPDAPVNASTPEMGADAGVPSTNVPDAPPNDAPVEVPVVCVPPDVRIESRTCGDAHCQSPCGACLNVNLYGNTRSSLGLALCSGPTYSQPVDTTTLFSCAGSSPNDLAAESFIYRDMGGSDRVLATLAAGMVCPSGVEVLGPGGLRTLGGGATVRARRTPPRGSWGARFIASLVPRLSTSTRQRKS